MCIRDRFSPIPEDAPRGPELLVNGGFESVSVPNNEFVQVASVPGWQVTGAGGEFWADGFQGQSASEGDVYAELDFDLDGVDGLSQTVSTTAGQLYEVSFDIKQRAGKAAATNGVELRINGVVVDTFAPGSTSWQSESFLFEGSGSDTIGLFETASCLLYTSPSPRDS